MPEQIEHIEGPDGSIETFTVWPDDGVPHPPVILYMDAPGIREELYEFCRRIAGEGYYVLLPDMYYRLGRLRFPTPIPDDDTRAKVFGAMNSLTNALVMKDTRALLDFLDTNINAAFGPAGCIGYCMSGRYVVSAAGTFPDRFAAAASLYGVGIVTDKEDSPHLLAPRIKAELYFGFAETDAFVPDNVIPDLEKALTENSVPYALDIWPGTEHGFCFPERAVYKEGAAEAVWKTVFSLFARRLPQE